MADHPRGGTAVRITLTSVHVDDQEKALRFYTDVLGFVKKTEIPLGEHRWLTVVSPQDPDGVELVLEPSDHPAVGPFRAALVADGIPWTSFAVDDVHAETDRLKALGVTFTQEPLSMGPVTTAVLDDTCGNLVQIASM
jgi:catechol 2,3-dioxygenase-like lactoylglutathione lyase family enzyme